MSAGLDWGDGTRSVRAGEDPAVPGAPLRPSPVFAAPFHLGDQPPRAGGADAYARTEHPTLRDFEAAVGELDGGRCLSFATGMAAISAAVLALVGAGDRVVLPVRRLLHDPAAGRRRARALRRRASSTCRPLEIEAFAAAGGLDGVRLVLLETPSNPQLDVCDIAAVARAARAAGALVAVDNTTATPLGQRPLELGAHLTVGSDTKALTGHSDLLLGHVSTTDDELYARLAGWRGHTGSTPGPVRGVARPPVDEHAGPAAGPAGDQRGRGRRGAGRRRPAVTGVRWPWRPADPSFALAARQMLRPNGVVSAELADEAAVRAGCWRPPGCGPRRPASAACTARSTGGRSGAATPSPRGSSGCPAASRTPTTWSTT